MRQRRNEHTFIVVLPPLHPLHRLFRTAGLDTFFPIASSREAALAAIRPRPWKN